MSPLFSRIVGVLGLSRQVSWTLAGRVWSLLAGFVSIGMVVRFLGPAEQGAYYTIVSLLAAQVFAELGLNFVLVQRAARGSAAVGRTAAGTLDGPAEDVDRLAGLYRFGFRWFAAGALAFLTIGSIVGTVLLTRGAGAGEAPLAVWLVACLGGTAMLAAIGPLAVLEGVGFVAEVAAVRFAAGLAGAIGTWLALAAGAGVAAAAVTPCIAAVTTWAVVSWRLGPAMRQLARRPCPAGLPWRREILPVQARIAASWIAGYAIAQLPTSLLFASRGAEDAGLWGMSIAIASAAGTVASSWLYPNQPELARLAARRIPDLMNTLFQQTLIRSVGAALVLSTCVMVALAVVVFTPLVGLSHRVLPTPAMGALLFGIVGSVISAAFAAYTRAFGGEPYLWVSLACAAGMLLVLPVVIPAAGAAGVAYAFAAVQWLIGVTGGWLVFRQHRRLLHGSVGCA